MRRKNKIGKGKWHDSLHIRPKIGSMGAHGVLRDDGWGFRWKSAHNFNIIIFLRLARAHIALKTWKPRNKPRLRVSFWLRPFISSAQIAASSLPWLSSCDDNAKNDLGPVVERGEVVLEGQNTVFWLVAEGLLLIVVDWREKRSAEED